MQPVRAAIDIHGGDFGTETILEGVLKAFNSSEYPFSATLCGEKQKIAEAFEKLGSSIEKYKEFFSIEDCRDIKSNVNNSSHSKMWKNDNSGSTTRCIALQKEGQADLSLSAGDTRVIIGASVFLLGCLKGIKRPALAALLPTVSKRPVLILDVGANLNCRIEHLVSFGKTGKDYFSGYFSVKDPAIALLNIGKEESKGTKVIIESGKIFKKTFKNYTGFIEGNRVLSGDADVVVCDGFAGNVLLKVCESFHDLFFSVVDNQKKDDSCHGLKKDIKILNPDNYGTAPLLGVRGYVFKAHGASSSHAVANALHTAVRAAVKKCINTE